MDSRQFAILVLAIFISTLALTFGEENATTNQSQTIANSSGSNSTIQAPVSTSKGTLGAESTAATTPAAPIDSSTTTVKPVAPIDSSSTATVKPVAPIESPTNTSGKVELATEVNSKPTDSSAASTTAAPTASSTDSAKVTEVVNDHSIRDVSSEKCSTAYNDADKVNWVPEKAILAVLEGNAVVTVDQLCKRLDVIKRLDAICNNTSVKLDSDDSKVAPIVAGLNSMFSSICSDTKTFSVPTGNSTPCVELVQSTTKNCSTNPLAKALHVFPTEVLYEDMVKENCTVVFKTKECIISGLEQSDKCTEPQRAAVKQAINMVTKVLPCSLPISAETTPAPTEGPTTATPTTTTPTVTTTKSHSHSSVNGFQANFFTVLPVLLLALKFY